MKLKLTTWILIAMLAGIGVGWMCHELLPAPEYVVLLPPLLLLLLVVVSSLVLVSPKKMMKIP